MCRGKRQMEKSIHFLLSFAMNLALLYIISSSSFFFFFKDASEWNLMLALAAIRVERVTFFSGLCCISYSGKTLSCKE